MHRLITISQKGIALTCFKTLKFAQKVVLSELRKETLALNYHYRNLHKDFTPEDSPHDSTMPTSVKLDVLF